ncbi:MAG TPA: hypothetical protein VNN19_05805, partial [bacterium]|nr:hypothetical protein [bacterium]
MDPIREDGGAGGRSEAGRRAARALASAYRTLRFYPLAHAHTADALRQAHAAIDAFTAAYGSLALAPAAQGLLIDAARTPYADDVVADLARALRAHAVPALHLLPGVSIEELGTLLTVLRLPRAQLEREGGAPAALAARGLRSVAVGRIASPGPTAERDSVGGLLDAVDKGSTAGVAPWLQDLADGEAFCVLARAVDRRLVVRPRAEQAAAWRLIGRTLTELPIP